MIVFSFVQNFTKKCSPFQKTMFPTIVLGMVSEPPIPDSGIAQPFVWTLILSKHVTTFYVFLYNHAWTFKKFSLQTTFLFSLSFLGRGLLACWFLSLNTGRHKIFESKQIENHFLGHYRFSGLHWAHNYNSSHLLIASHALSTVLIALQISAHLILTIHFSDRYFLISILQVEQVSTGWLKDLVNKVSK